MNKRQAKKQFKKKYGCTPDECAKNLQVALGKIMEAVSDALVQSKQIQEHENDC